MIELRRTTSDDPRFLAAVALLDAEMWRRYGEVQGAYAPFNRVDNLATVVVAQDGDRVVGCGCFKWFSPTDAELKRMYVVDDARGQRIGARVLTTLETWARELGYE
ncbi:MAG: GNAT family N-acetyltransferase, partial [Proteobacteria bacterium]|nr:GNAT family N-acetyltransferase [Pseudomonadota bacterium]